MDTHTIINKFISDYNVHAYVINFDEQYLLDRPCTLQLRQLHYYDGFNNLIELSYFKAKSISNLVCLIEFQNDINGIADRWIPNTNEKCKPFKINMTGEDADQIPVNIPEYLDFKILPPHDPNWDVNDAGNNNINRNKGTCEYDLYATNQQGTSAKWLATFEINDDAATIDDSYSIVEYNSAYFNSEGIPDSGYKLRVDAEGYMYFKIYDDPEYEYFTIKAVSDPATVIRPGDDFQLRFTLAHIDYDGSPGIASAGSFMAVYDKKLLWRANLFIDEDDFDISDYDNNVNAMGATQGITDWNDQNPWVEGNVWNRVYNGINDYIPNYSTRYPVGTGASLFCDDNLTDLPVGNGGQVVNILPGTWPINYVDDNTNRDTDGSVLYYWGASNSPFSYNDRIENWRQGLRTYFSDPLHQDNTLENWDYTYAPETGPNVNRPGSHIWENYDYNNLSSIPGARRGLNTFYNATSCGYDNFPYETDIETIGVDCGGLVYLSVSYEGNIYNFDGAGPDDICNGYRNWIDVGVDEDPNAPADAADNLWWISERGDLANLNKVIPGDIFYYWTYHVAIIRAVSYDENRDATTAQVQLIEAVWGNDDVFGQFGCVIAFRTIGLDYNDRNWIIGRLKTE